MPVHSRWNISISLLSLTVSSCAAADRDSKAAASHSMTRVTGLGSLFISYRSSPEAEPASAPVSLALLPLVPGWLDQQLCIGVRLWHKFLCSTILIVATDQVAGWINGEGMHFNVPVRQLERNKPSSISGLPSKSKFMKSQRPKSVIQKSFSFTMMSNGKVNGAPMERSNSNTAGIISRPEQIHFSAGTVQNKHATFRTYSQCMNRVELAWTVTITPELTQIIHIFVVDYHPVI